MAMSIGRAVLEVNEASPELSNPLVCGFRGIFLQLNMSLVYTSRTSGHATPHDIHRVIHQSLPNFLATKR